MRLAKQLGLAVANVEMRQANDTPYHLVEPYTQEIDGEHIRFIQ